ncbi:unnamed protein product [Calypogeia fissa]
MAAEGKLNGKVALVTGGSGAIGSEICRSLASERAIIVVAGLNGNDEVTSAHTAGGKAIFVKTDQSPEADVAALDKAVEAFGGVQVVVQVAGITAMPNAAIEETTMDSWEKVFAVNCKAHFS